MAGPLDLLPLINGDTYKNYSQDFSTDTIAPGNEATTSLPAKRGFYFGAASTIVGEGGEDAELTITIDNFQVDATFRELYNAGFVSPQGITPGISRYDTDNNIFTAIHSPNRPLGFNDVVKFSQRASDGGSEIRADTDIYSIAIVKPRKFVKEYIELTNPRFALELGEGQLDEFIKRFEEGING